MHRVLICGGGGAAVSQPLSPAASQLQKALVLCSEAQRRAGASGQPLADGLGWACPLAWRGAKFWKLAGWGREGRGSP